jgi:hypothetical protein
MDGRRLDGFGLPGSLATMALVTALLLLAQPALPEIVRRKPAMETRAPVEAEPVPDTPEPPLPEPAALYGDWRLGLTRGGRSCVLGFDAAPQGFGWRGLGVGANCPDGLFAINRWRLEGAVLELAGRDGRALARFTRQPDGNWQGQRLSDGASLVMGRKRAAIVR